MAVVVDVWTSRPAAVTDRGRAVLDDGERSRAAALPAHAAERFVLARVLLRHALAARMGCHPAAVVLQVRCPRCGGPHGPVTVLRQGPLHGGTPALPHVSVTRAGPVVAVAVCDSGPVGIDVETTAAVAAAPLADVALSPRELSAHRHRPEHVRARALARTWVFKEAALKALGTGLDVEPSTIDVRFLATSATGVDAVVGDSVAVADLAVGRGGVGAVAVVAPGLVGSARSAPGGSVRRLVVRRYDGESVLARDEG